MTMSTRSSAALCQIHLEEIRRYQDRLSETDVIGHQVPETVPELRCQSRVRPPWRNRCHRAGRDIAGVASIAFSDMEPVT
jgi:hypothetical protein